VYARHWRARCFAVGPACQAYWKTDAVFDAVVLDIESLPRDPDNPFLSDTLVKLDVRQSWKGAAIGPLEVSTASTGAACGYSFKKGGRYLVFARRATGARLQVSLCSGTKEWDGTGPAAEFLASLASEARGGRVFGTTRTHARTFGAPPQRIEADTVTTVRIVGIGVERSVTARGRYEFADLPAGHYTVTTTMPDGYTTWQPVREVGVPDTHACAEENFDFSPAGGITGRVVGPDGRGLPRIRIEITSYGMQPTPMYGYASADTSPDADGYFTVAGLAPGRYVAAINLKDLPSESNPYPRTFYPEGSRADVVTLSLGQTIDLGAWQLPPPLVVVPLRGVITWSDGTPAAGLYVFLRDVTGNPVDSARGAGQGIADANGQFVVQVRRSRTYTFGVREGGGPQSPWLRITAPRVAIGADPPEPIRIVVERPR
jgi:hypothetical protein